MFEDILDTHDKEKYYYHSSYLKPVYQCDDCNFTLTTLDGEKETEICPICGKSIKRKLVPLEFWQSHNNATMISC